MIKVTIKDPEALEKIKLKNVITYLENDNSWTNLDKTSPEELLKVNQTWYNVKDRHIQIPRKEGTSDKKIRMAELLMALEIVEERSQLEAYADLMGKSITVKHNPKKLALKKPVKSVKNKK